MYVRKLQGSLTIEAAFALPFFIIAVSQIIFWTGFLEAQAGLGMEANSLARKMAETAFIEYEGEEAREVKDIEIPKGKVLNGTYFEILALARPFTGRYYKKSDYDEAAKDERIVFVAKNGKVYHTSNICTHIKLSVREVAYTSVASLRNKGGGRYYPCEYCMRKRLATRVYITDEGNKMHIDLNCGGIKRTVDTMTRWKAEEKGYGPCSRCGNKHD